MTLRRPNFLVVGAQKCGTSYLCAALARHPDVFHSVPKEPLFFQRGDVSATSFDTYLEQHFRDCGTASLVGEGSTVYFQWPNALENIRRHLGDSVRIIVSLRHPTDRAVSFYLHNVRKGRLAGTEPIRGTGRDVRDSPVLSSMYANHLERWLDAYGSQVEVLLFDDLARSPMDFVGRAADFLGITRPARLNHAPVNRGFDLVWEDGRLMWGNGASSTGHSTSFSQSELEDMHALFLPDIERAESLLGRSLASWKLMPEFTAKQKNW